MKRIPFFNSPVLHVSFPLWRAKLVQILLFLAFAALMARALYLQVVTTDFLIQKGDERYTRTRSLPATRGKISDRNGVVLAASMPAKAIWAVPENVNDAPRAKLNALAELLSMKPAELDKKLQNEDKTFVYLQRQVPLDIAQKIAELKIPGVNQDDETKRYYPEG